MDERSLRWTSVLFSSVYFRLNLQEETSSSPPPSFSKATLLCKTSTTLSNLASSISSQAHARRNSTSPSAALFAQPQHHFGRQPPPSLPSQAASSLELTPTSQLTHFNTNLWTFAAATTNLTLKLLDSGKPHPLGHVALLPLRLLLRCAVLPCRGLRFLRTRHRDELLTADDVPPFLASEFFGSVKEVGFNENLTVDGESGVLHVRVPSGGSGRKVFDWKVLSGVVIGSVVLGVVVVTLLVMVKRRVERKKLEEDGEYGLLKDKGEGVLERGNPRLRGQITPSSLIQLGLKPQLPLGGSLPLSGTQELTGDPLRGKMAAEGKKPTHALIAERHTYGLGRKFSVILE
ncbi:hypothetical protein LR48_Vigan04g092300 [Vigna angularis]|uniref:Uncharacterized protein n=1 Tax=Phaseolus angularis TaxID=3914 RepID=A0A0L9UCR6_PHAAN|nr:hypothetical protein LR48_Vigan04g092300 [Vigna angularis]